MKLNFKQLLKDTYQLMDPRRIAGFFKDLQPKPVKEVMSYLFLLGLFTFIGYTLRYGFFSEPNYLGISLRISFLYYLIGIYVPTGVISIFAMSYFLHLAGEKLVKRAIGREEAMNLIGYAAIPSLIGGFFGIFLETQILHILLIGYSIYLLYTAMKIKFGFNFSLRALIFVIASGFIFSMIFFLLGAFLLRIPGQYYGVG